MAAQLANELNSRLNYIPTEGGDTTEEAADECHYYEEELEINDFPQPVRWKVCSRVSLCCFIW